MLLSDLNAEFVRKTQLFGISTTTEEGESLEDEVIDFYIREATKQMESFLGISIIPKTSVLEKQDYRQDVWRNYSFIQLYQRPVTCVTSFKVKFGDNEIFQAPADWIRLDKLNGQIHLFPTLGTFASVPMLGLSALSPVLLKTDKAPHVFEIIYDVGLEDIEEDMAGAIAIQASNGVFALMGELVIGAGIAAISVGFDGWSQSIQTTSSAENSAYSARVKLNMEKLWGDTISRPGLMQSLRAKHRRIPIVVL